jgi:anti-sigma regulatory factor (Ser/Thr protein kinase)
LRYRGTPRFVREARAAVIDYARICGFPSASVFDIALGVGEALANAVEHGNKSLGFICVTCTFEAGELVIEVLDEGPGFDIGDVTKRQRRANAVRGFGISIMHSVMDRIEYERRGSCVRLHKRLPNADAQSGAVPDSKEA